MAGIAVFSVDVVTKARDQSALERETPLADPDGHMTVLSLPAEHEEWGFKTTTP
jgi:hypothetical protein